MYVYQIKVIVVIPGYNVNDFGMDQQIALRNAVAKVGTQRLGARSYAKYENCGSYVN